MTLGVTLDDALGLSEAAKKDSDLASSELIQRYHNEDDVRDLIDLARKLEDLTRNAGKHAGGVVIAPRPLTDFSPLFAEHVGKGETAKSRRHPVRQGRRRGDRPGQVRLPRPAHADHHRLGGEGDQSPPRRREPASRSTSSRCRSTTRRPTRCCRKRRHHRGVPVRIARHEGLHQASCSRDVLRGPDRAGRAVPPRPAGRRHGRRLHRPQARPRRSQLSASAPGGDPQADLRRHRLPGTGDADRPGPGRLFARRRRPAAPRDGQEKARGNGQGTRQVRGRRRGHTASTPRSRRRSST